MKRILICILSVLLCVPFRAQNDPVVMTVNGYDVTKSEFEYFFKKNNSETKVTKKTVMQYADLYLNFKLKVQAAIDAGMDKSESFLNEYRMYRDMQAEDYLIDRDFLEDKAREAFDNSLREVGEDGLAYIHVISSYADEDEGRTEEDALKIIDIVYQKLEEGQPFEELAREYSSDNLAESGGDAGWVSRRQLPEDVANVVFSLETGKYSFPFQSEDVWFIVKVDARRQLGTYEENHDDVYEWVLKSRAYDDSKRLKANEYATKLGWTIRDDEAVTYLDSCLEEIEPEFGNISREYHDGLLLFDISNREIWERVSDNPQELEEFFKSHPEQFKFDKPCYKGMVLFCRNEDTYKELKTILDGTDMSEWVDSILAFNKGNNIRVRVMRSPSETGIFKQGQNVYIDKIVFGKGDGYEPMDGYPYVNVVGRILKEPESFDDVAGEITDVYQKYLEDEWVRQLRSKYKYKINKKALKKVSL